VVVGALHDPAPHFSRSTCLIPRVACRIRCSFSTSANRTNPSPSGPNPIPGDTATILIKSPYKHAKALITTEREKIFSWQVVDLKALPFPAYRASLERRQPSGWLTAQNQPELKPLDLLLLLNRLAHTNRVFYLQPTPGDYLFEEFYPQPHAAVAELKFYEAGQAGGTPEKLEAARLATTGGAPKGVMVSHRNIECNTRDIISYLGLTPKDRVMVVLPFHYCFGISLLHTHLLAGASVVLNNGFKLYPEEVLQEMQQRECTGLAGVPSTYQILLRKSRFRELSFPALRWFQQAGGKLPNPYITEILGSFPAVRFFLMYGQTEATARLSYLPPERLGDKLGSIGKGLPSGRLEVLRPDGTPVRRGANETGEIVASIVLPPAIARNLGERLVALVPKRTP